MVLQLANKKIISFFIIFFSLGVGFYYFSVSYPVSILWARDADFAMQTGNYYFNNGAYDLKKAEISYKRALKINPGILWGHYQLARIYFVRAELGQALKEINLELEVNPENLRSLYVRGLIYGYSDNLKEAELDFYRFIEWAPGEWAGYNDLAWVLSKQGKYKETETIILKAFQKAPDAKKNPWLWNSLGVAQLNLMKYYTAEESFKIALSLLADMDTEKWIAVYPGNDPGESEFGIKSFREAVEKNIQRARVL